LCEKGDEITRFDGTLLYLSRQCHSCHNFQYLGQYNKLFGKEYILALRWFEMDTNPDQHAPDAYPDPNRQALDADPDPQHYICRGLHTMIVQFVILLWRGFTYVKIPEQNVNKSASRLYVYAPKVE
jgi:hypothetical protein